MKRLSWLSVANAGTAKDFQQYFKKAQYSGEALDGFVVSRIRENSIDAKFVERLESVETVVDPFGNELKYSRVDFRQTEFRLLLSEQYLELHDAPRGSSSFISRLGEVTGFRIAIGRIEANVMAWAKSFERLANAKCVIDSIQVAGLELADGVSAKIVLKGEKDVRPALRELVGKRHVSIEKVQLHLTDSPGASIILTRTGAAKLSGASNDSISWLRRALSDARTF